MHFAKPLKSESITTFLPIIFRFTQVNRV